MSQYSRPDVYIERIASGTAPMESAGTSIAGVVGVAPRGKIGEAVLVTSWTDYVDKFARGLKSPFIKDSDLPYAMYGYFQNGGTIAYVVRVATESASKAVLDIGEGISLEALDEGTWANNLEVEIVGDVENTLNVYLDKELVEVFENVSANTDDDNYVLEVVNSSSKYIRVISATEIAVNPLTSFSGGEDGIEDISDTDYLDDKGLKALDIVEQISLVAIPGQTSKPIHTGVIDYCENRKDCFAVLDMPLGLDTTEALAYKKEMGGNYGAIYYPWGKVVDPLNSSRLRLVPPSGHILGVYARTDSNRGVHKAPAGLEARVSGFVELERPLSNSDIDLLNPQGINCIVAKPNNGIVVWGARMLSPHLDRKYISDIRLDIDVEKSLYSSTQWAVFEPNDEKLWGDLVAQVKAYLHARWTEGALFGETPEEAFFVKCDAELNTQEVRDSGRVLVDVGYAKKKPAEFTIFRLSQKTANE